MEDQRSFYETYHGNQIASDVHLPVEDLKQNVRLQTLSELANSEQYRSVLVVGCGTGQDLRAVNGLEVVALDLSWTAVNQAKNNFSQVEFLQASGMDLPLSAASFDMVFCSEVIEHVPEPKKLISEFHRILEMDGILLISTPNWISWWGAARLVSQLILRRPVTSSGQPVDNWFTSWQLSRVLRPYFEVEQRRGAWYFPPTGLGMQRIPDRWVAPIMRKMLPIDKQLSSLTPGLGHLHLWRARRLGLNISQR